LTTSTTTDYLDALGRYALRYVKPGHTVGLGTGRAAAAFIRALGESGLGVRGVPTSNASAELARSLGIELVSMGEVEQIDVDVDGADEVDPRLNLMKGHGGALVREKVVAAASRRCVVLVGAEKLVKSLGSRMSLPVEVVPFAEAFTARQISALGLEPKVRTNQNGDYFLTDNQNLILDCVVRKIRNPSRLDRELLSIPGVVGTGLFVGFADIVVVAGPDGKIRTLRRRAR
jgi:ribose 5-phosphate isomerase A